VDANNVNMFKNNIDKYPRRVGYTYIIRVGLSINQRLPCPLAV